MNKYALVGLLVAAMGVSAGCTSDGRSSGTTIGQTTTITGDGDGDGDGDAGETGDDGDDMRLDAAVGDGDGDGDDGGSTGDPCMDAAMASSNQGCEFFAVDLPNVWGGTNGLAPENMQYAVVVANTSDDTSAPVSVYQGNATNVVQSAMVAPGAIHTFALPALNTQPRADSQGTAYRIESDLPVTAYQFNPLDNTTQVYSNDASILFPTPVLNDDYIAVTGDAIWLCYASDIFGCTASDNAGAFVTVAATEDGTNVQIYPTRPTYSYQSGSVVTLNRGQTYTVVSNDTNANGSVAGQGNLSGTRVTADKPVAVFSGNVAALEPTPPAGGYADHMEHQMLPLTAWGNAYAVAPAPRPTGAAFQPTAYRITGAFDGTQLTYAPSAPAGAPTTIGAGQTVRFQSTQAFTVTATDPDKPFTITQFLLSNEAANPSGEPGDPAMIVMPAAEQFQERYIFLVPDGYAANFVTIYRPSGAPVTLDGQDVAASGNWLPIGVLGGVAWEFANFSVGVGSHTVDGGVDGTLGIVSVGYDDDVSYGYPGGSGVAIISEPPPPPAG